MSLIDHFDCGVRIKSDHPVFTFNDTKTSYRAAQDQNRRIANALRAKGVGPGRKSAEIFDNNPFALNAVRQAAEEGSARGLLETAGHQI